MKKTEEKFPSVGIRILVFNEENKILLGRRKDCGKLGLPGGKLEMYELPEEAARREVLEETNLDFEISQFKLITIKHIIDRDRVFHFVNYYFGVKCDSKKSEELKNMEEDKCEGWVWMPTSVLEEKRDELFFGLKKFIDYYKNGAKEMIEEVIGKFDRGATV